ncbi:fatty acyl-AMP ligase [Streptomyces sp. NPDC046557]|uniref:fatty acyl-AMP ligase n=1 Tax=Streptomyces sp. NPDC046557 TaxID=3155372 RepID=UPI0033C4798E
MPVDLVSRLVQHGHETPDREAVVFVRNGASGLLEEPLTYGELDRKARAVASWLRERCAIGDRVLMLYGTGPDFVTVLAGCMYAGVVAVPAPQPSSQRGHSSRSDGIVRDADVRMVLTDSEYHGTAAEFLTRAELQDVPCVATDRLDLPDAPDWQVEPPTADKPVIIQYTSGSTSAPKGVVVTWGSLTHNISLMTRAFAADSESRSCSWLPAHHDMGLIGMLLTPLYHGAVTYQLAPMDFLRRPHLWLELIGLKQIKTVVAPNFAYDLCTRRVTDAQLEKLDFRTLTSAGNGAEPIDAGTLHRFAERFAPAGFRLDHFSPCYGMAETTLIVAGTRPDEPPVVTRVDGDALAANEFRPVSAEAQGPELVSSGRVHDMDLRIVDPDTRATLHDGRIGEIWVRGGSIAAGYWRNEQATEQTFHADTADTPESARGFLRTGDIGTLYDGSLYVTGRIKDVLIVNGRNLHPHDIERELLALHEGFRGLSGSACSIPVTGEQIVVMQEIRRPSAEPGELAALTSRLRGELSERVGVRIPNLVLLRPGQVRKTTSGKVQHSLMRELFIGGGLEAVFEDLDAAAARRYRSEGTSE